MSPTVLPGLSGSDPLGFMAALGLLRIVRRRSERARLAFLSDGTFRAVIEGFEANLGGLIAEDAGLCATKPAWRLTYEKAEKNGVKVVADLKAPPSIFHAFLRTCVAASSPTDGEPAAYAAAFGTSVAVDGKGNTKPTAFHFTAANQQFLGTVEAIREAITPEWATRSLSEGHAGRPGSNLRWDPAADRNWALMANNPNDEGTSVDAPAEWLAFRALPFFPSFPVRTRIRTTGVSGRGDEMKLVWPLWSLPASVATVRSLLQLPWAGAARDRAGCGVFAICTSAIRRTGQGFGNFSPAAVAPP